MLFDTDGRVFGTTDLPAGVMRAKGITNARSAPRTIAKRTAALRARNAKRKAQLPVARPMFGSTALPEPAIFEPPAFARVGKAHLLARLSTQLRSGAKG